MEGEILDGEGYIVWNSVKLVVNEREEREGEGGVNDKVGWIEAN